MNADPLRTFRQAAELMAAMDRVRRERAQPRATNTTIEMVEVAPGTFAPDPAANKRRRAANGLHTLAAVFDELQRGIKK